MLSRTLFLGAAVLLAASHGLEGFQFSTPLRTCSGHWLTRCAHLHRHQRPLSSLSASEGEDEASRLFDQGQPDMDPAKLLRVPAEKGRRSLLKNAVVNTGKSAASQRFLAETRRLRRSAQLRQHSSTGDQSELPPINRPSDIGTPERDYEAHQPGHVVGKSVLSLMSTSLLVPLAPPANDGASSSPDQEHDQDHDPEHESQVIVCSASHDGLVKIWRLQAQPRLFVEVDMCAQAPLLMQVGLIHVDQGAQPAADVTNTVHATSIFSLAYAETEEKDSGCELLVGEGRSRQVSRWRLSVQGAMPRVLGAGGSALQSGCAQTPHPDALSPFAVAEQGGKTDDRSEEEWKPSAPTSRSYGWQLHLDMDSFTGASSPPLGDVHDEDQDADSDDDEVPAVGEDGSTMMRVEEDEITLARDSGGWTVVAARQASLPALHTGWVRSLACDAFNLSGGGVKIGEARTTSKEAADIARASTPVPNKLRAQYAFSVGCNFIKVWSLDPHRAEADSGARAEIKAGRAIGRQGSVADDAPAKWLGDLQVQGDILCVAAAGGGRMVLSGSVDGSLRVWNLAPFLAGNSPQLLKQARPFVVEQAHDGRLTALVLPHAPLGEQDKQAAGAVFTCGHDGFVRRWSIVETREDESPVLQLEAEVDVVAAMGLHADDDERLLCMTASPPDSGQAERGNMASVSGTYLYVGTSSGSVVVVDQKPDVADKALFVVQMSPRLTSNRGGGKITALTSVAYPRAPARKALVCGTSQGRVFCWLPFV